jgi:hypothetical protein
MKPAFVLCLPLESLSMLCPSPCPPAKSRAQDYFGNTQARIMTALFIVLLNKGLQQIDESSKIDQCKDFRQPTKDLHSHA